MTGDPAAPARPPVLAPRPLWAAFLVFLGPMMLGNLLQALSGTINGIWLGQLLGVKALAAVAGFVPIMFFCIAFVIGLGTGASVLIGQAWGAREPERVKAVAGAALSMTLLAGLAMATLGSLFTAGILALLGTPADILPEATAYARVMMFAIPGLFVFILSTSMMRGVGDSTTQLYALALSLAIGLVATPALIQGWLGLPRLGVASGAWASVGSMATTLLCMGLWMRHRRHPLAPDRALLRHCRPDPAILRKVLAIGLPSGLQLVVVSLADLALLWLVNGFGSNATAAFGAVNQIVGYVQFPAISIGITASIFGAQAIGAGRQDRLGAIVRTAILTSLAIVGGLVALAYLFARTAIGFFVVDPPVVELAVGLLHIALWSYVAFGIASVLGGTMRASGTVLWPVAISMACIVLIEVPAAWLLSRRFGVEGVWMAYPIALLAMAAGQTAYYRLVWRKKTIVRLI